MFFRKKAEIFCVELNFRKQKSLIFCCHNPHKHQIKDNLLQIKNAINFYSKSYENIILIGDFDVEISDGYMGCFCTIHHLKSLIKEPTCNKKPEKRTCIDLILTNSPRQFQATVTLETGLLDFHKMAVAGFKSEFPRQKPKMISYQNYKVLIEIILKRKLKNAYFTEDLTQRLSRKLVLNIQ